MKSINYIKGLSEQQKNVIVFLSNGVKLSGEILSVLDDGSFLLTVTDKSNQVTGEQFVNIHNLSTIVSFNQGNSYGNC